MRREPLAKIAEVNPSPNGALRLLPETTVSFLPMSAVSENGYVLEEQERLVSEVLKGYTPFQRGDILVAKITPCMENGKAAFLDNLSHEYGFGSTEFHVVRPGPEMVGQYLFYMLWNPAFRREAEMCMTGSAGQKRVPSSFVERFTVPVPETKDEQRRIAAILDEADALRWKRAEAIRLANELVPTIFNEMFGRRLESWEQRPLSTFVEEFRYGTSNQFTERGRPTLRIPNVVGEQLDLRDMKLALVSDDEFARLRCQDGDVFFVRTNGNPEFIGRSAPFDSELIRASGYDPSEVIYASYLIRARLDRSQLCPTFLQAYLRSPVGRRAVRSRARTSAGNYNINTEALGTIPVPNVPPGLQQDFASRAHAIGAIQTHLSNSRREVDNLFHSLLQRAFRGEL
jgi:type I restriction enzyme S subunit